MLRSITIFTAIVLLNLLLIALTGIYGLLVVDLAAILTLLILLLDKAERPDMEKIRRTNKRHNRRLIAQAEDAAEEFDEKDLPSHKDIKELVDED